MTCPGAKDQILYPGLFYFVLTTVFVMLRNGQILVNSKEIQYTLYLNTEVLHGAFKDY